MITKNKILAVFAALLCINFSAVSYAKTTVASAPQILSRYPDYASLYLGNDKFEKFNRKMFKFNQKLNKYALKPIHVVWASVMPKYGMDRIQSAYTNIEYPKRLVSSLIQRDFKATGRETVRFLTNTTLGLGGMYDPAKSVFHLEPMQESMEQALAKIHVKSGPYLVVPVMSATCPRALAGKILECPLDPSLYIAGPITALVKFGLFINRTSYMQPLIKMVESNFADPYDITKKLYGVESYIKEFNYDREDVLEAAMKLLEKSDIKNPENEINVGVESDRLVVDDVIKGSAQKDEASKNDMDLSNPTLLPDMVLADYNPQAPVTDSMRTALFNLPGVDDSIWAEISIWNRCFAKRIKTSSINIDPKRDDYKFRYIMQKDKNAPLAIIFPSIGEGMTSHHSVILAKIFYDEGYSVAIEGSHFHWEFAKSMPEGYHPGIPNNDIEYVRAVTSKIIAALSNKYDCNFDKKVVIGTSFGAMASLYLADMESRNNTLGITKFISVNPPIELLYALNKLDKNNEEWNKNPNNIKDRVALTAAKILSIYQKEDKSKYTQGMLPFSEDEAKLITCFVMRQKLSDLIFTLENATSAKPSGIYDTINNMSYLDYAGKYLIKGSIETPQELNEETSLFKISDYLISNNNYRIYHTLDDYFVNQDQLRLLKEYSRDNMIIVSNGGHLGYMYRQEFLDSLKKDISIKNLVKESSLASAPNR